MADGYTILSLRCQLLIQINFFTSYQRFSAIITYFEMNIRQLITPLRDVNIAVLSKKNLE